MFPEAERFKYVQKIERGPRYNRGKLYSTHEKRALTPAAETPHALLSRHHLCDPKSFAHAQRGVAEKNSNYEAVIF